MSGDMCGCYISEGVVVLLKFGGQRPGILLNILQCTRDLPANKELSDENVNSTAVLKPCPIASMGI